MFEIKLIDSDKNIKVNGNNLVISDAYYHSFSFMVMLNGKRTNQYRCIYSNDFDWVTVKSEIEEYNDELYTKFSVYIKNNYSEYNRAVTLQLLNIVDNTSELVELSQQACDFKIKVNDSEDDSKILTLNNTETQIRIQVYGASKKIILKQNFIEIIKDEKELGYDKSLYYIIVPDNKNSTTEYNQYILKIKCLGDFQSLNNYIYNVPIIHYDDQNCVFNLKLRPTLGNELNEEEMENIINEEYSKIVPSDTISMRNEKNKVAEISENNISVTNTIALFKMSREMSLPELDPISDIKIKGNTITLQTNVYDENNNVINNSMILLQPKAIWCKARSEYRDNKHYITVKCEDNYWDINRKTFLVVRNAESMRATGKVTFLITQKINNSIVIKKYKS